MVRYKKSGETVVSAINITPFTDIVLVLLIVFMISAPGILSPGLDITLPGSQTSKTHKPASYTVGLDREGKIYLDSKLVNLQELKNTIAMQAAKDPELSIVLNADSAAKHGEVISVLDAVRSSGAANIYVGTIKK